MYLPEVIVMHRCHGDYLTRRCRYGRRHNGQQDIQITLVTATDWESAHAEIQEAVRLLPGLGIGKRGFNGIMNDTPR